MVQLGPFQQAFGSPGDDFLATATATGDVFFSLNAPFEVDNGSGTFVQYPAGFTPAITPVGTITVRSNNAPTEFKTAGTFTLTSVDITQCSTINSFQECFLNCRNLTSVTITGDTSALTTMVGMFQSCLNITSLPLFNTANVINMNNVCFNCRKLTAVPAWDTGNVLFFSGSFRSCFDLVTVPLLDTSSGTNFSRMFQQCTVLPSIPLFDMSLGTNFLATFLECDALTTIPAINFSSGDSFEQTFLGCSALTSLPALDTSSGRFFNQTFQDCILLQTIAALDTTNTIGPSAQTFQNCSSLTSPDSATQALLVSASGFDFN